MNFLYLIGFLLLVLFANAQDRSLGEVRRVFAVANIPENLNIEFDPTVLLEVSLPQKAGPDITLHAGIQLPRNATAGPPSFSVCGAAGRGPFVVAAVDPDAPTPQNPTSAQIRHFLGGSFVASHPSTRGAHPLVNSTAAISPYRQPTPPAGSDAHRYIFLLFKQPAGFNDQELVNSTTPVQLFNISQFAAATGLGAPLGGTFMLVAPNPPAA